MICRLSTVYDDLFRPLEEIESFGVARGVGTKRNLKASIEWGSKANRGQSAQSPRCSIILLVLLLYFAPALVLGRAPASSSPAHRYRGQGVRSRWATETVSRRAGEEVSTFESLRAVSAFDKRGIRDVVVDHIHPLEGHQIIFPQASTKHHQLWVVRLRAAHDQRRRSSTPTSRSGRDRLAMLDE